MREKRGFTLIELLVVIATIAVLISILMPAMNRAKEAGKRASCLSNLKNLVYAWNMYADDNTDRICSGRIGASNNGTPAWCGDASTPQSGVVRSKEEQEAAIKNGALYSYLKTYSPYKCSTSVRGEYESYAVVDSMNGEAADLSQADKANRRLVCRSRNDILRPANRIIFLDEGFITPSSFAIRYTHEYWWDIPAIRHGGGSTFSFADAHIDFYKWSGLDTIKLGQIRDLGASQGNKWSVGVESTPKSLDAQRDLQFMQMGCYGKLGYTPTSF